MFLRSAFTKLLGFAGLLVAATSAGCSCDGGSQVACSDAGVCQICDAYGCRSADLSTGGSGGATGTGGKGTGGVTGTGGKGTGGAGTGGAAPCDPTQATCPCDANGACPAGKDCINGLCINGCNFDYECGPGMVCDNGACVPGCSTSSPCPTGYTCTNGACEVDSQNPQCDAAHPCPAGEICANGLCTTHCTSDSQCAAGQVCDGGSQTCITDPSTKPGCTNTCKAPEVCGSDGFCHYPCTSETQCKLIDNRFVACDQGICKTEEEVNPQCTLTMPCPMGQSCISNHCY